MREGGNPELPANLMDSRSPLRFARNDKLTLAKAGDELIIYNKATTFFSRGSDLSLCYSNTNPRISIAPSEKMSA